MQKKHWIAPGIVAIILVVSSLGLSSSKPAVAKEKPTCCKKIQKKCTYQKETPASEQTSLDNLSNQFILIPLKSF